MWRYLAVAATSLVTLSGCSSQADLESFPEGTHLLRAAQPVLGQYIVVLDDTAHFKAQDWALDATVDDLEQSVGGEAFARYRAALNGFAVRMTEDDAIRLSRDPRVL